MISPTLYSSASMEWATPQDLFDRLHARFNFTLDVCATPENAKLPRYFTKEQDGLSPAHSWGGERVWCNPPYGRSETARWVQRCSAAGMVDGSPGTFAASLAVMLVPARTDTRWWHDYVIPHGKVEFIKGRLRFGGAKNSAPFPSAVVVFGGP